MKGHIKVKSYHSATPKLNIPSQIVTVLQVLHPASPASPDNGEERRGEEPGGVK